MLAATALSALKSHQKLILDTISRGEPLLRRPGPTDTDELSRIRWELCRLLRAYQLFKHTELFDPIIARGAPERSALARAAKARCLALDGAWREHVRFWTVTGVVQQWPSYAAAAGAISKQLRQHLAREQRDVEALLAGQPRTRCQPRRAAER